jgi:predicted aspartyl protease
MIRAPGSNADLVPVTINGMLKNFLFDTGGDRSQIEPGVVEALNLPVQHANTTLYSATGTTSQDMARVDRFSLGGIQGESKAFLISPITGLAGTADGILAPDMLEAYDLDVDFGTNRLTLFQPGQCTHMRFGSGKMTVLPLTIDRAHIRVPVTLDGHEILALVDTGATNTALRMDIAQRVYGLTMGAEDTPAHGVLNEDWTLITYRHTFHSLSFGGITLNAPPIMIFPDVMDRSESDSARLSARIKGGKEHVTAPELILGMDALRALHVTFAFHDRQIHISPAAPEDAALPDAPEAPAMLRAAYKRYAADRIGMDNQELRSRSDPQLFNERCWMRATAKIDLDAALADCDRAIRLKPGMPAFLDSRAFVFYQQGKYADALRAYNEVLQTDPRFPSALFMRGYARGKLGDESGKAVDLAAAREAQPDIAMEFQPFDISY